MPNLRIVPKRRHCWRDYGDAVRTGDIFYCNSLHYTMRALYSIYFIMWSLVVKAWLASPMRHLHRLRFLATS